MIKSQMMVTNAQILKGIYTVNLQAFCSTKALKCLIQQSSMSDENKLESQNFQGSTYEDIKQIL